MKGNRLFSRRFGYMLIFPSAIVFLIVSIYPLLTGIMLSFQNSSLYKGDEKKFVGLKNIITILTSDAEFRSDLLFTVIYTIGIVVIAYITGLVFSLLLNTDVPCRTLFRVLILIPWVISPAVSSMSWSWLLSDQYGFFNNFLKSIGVIDKSILFLADKTLAKIMVIIIGAWRNFPFITVSLLAGLQGISKDYYEAADIDGANKFQRFRYVTFPHLKNVSIITITLVSIWTFNNFDNIYMLTKGGPAQSTEVLSILAYNNAFFRGNISYASAMATVMLVIMLIASGVYFKVSMERSEIDNYDKIQEKDKTGFTLFSNGISFICS